MATRHIDVGNDRTRKHHTYSDGEHKYPGVTGITGCLPKPFLVGWSARMSAELAVDSIDYVGQMVARDRKGAMDYLGYAHTRYSNSRADLGSRAHVLFEQMMRGETPGRVHPDLEQHKVNFAEFLDAAQPTLLAAEDIAWSDSYQYAGSFDAIMRLRLNERGDLDQHGEPADILVDYKTSKRIYPDVALQLAAYRHADEIVFADDTAKPMWGTDGGAVLWVTDADWDFRLLDTGDDVFDVFVALRRRIYDWEHSLSRHVIGRSLARKSRLITGTERRGR